MWPGLSIKCPHFFEEVTYWFERNFNPSPRPRHILTSGREESERDGKERVLFYPHATLFLTLKTRFVGIRNLMNKSRMERETAPVSESFNDLQTVPALRLPDCDDVLS